MTPPPNQQEHFVPTALDPADLQPQDPEPDKLQTLRQILVGDELDHLEGQLETLETNLDGRHARLRNELMSEFEALQSQSKFEIKELGDMVVEMVRQLRIEDTTHADGIEKIESRLTDLEQRVDEMNQTLSSQVRALREETSSQLSEISAMVRSQQEDVARQAISRSDFAKMLSGLAGSLTTDGTDSTEMAAPYQPES